MKEGMKICDHCKGNGYTKVYDMIIQCDTCKSQGEVKYRLTVLELKEEHRLKEPDENVEETKK